MGRALADALPHHDELAERLHQALDGRALPPRHPAGNARVAVTPQLTTGRRTSGPGPRTRAWRQDPGQPGGDARHQERGLRAGEAVMTGQPDRPRTYGWAQRHDAVSELLGQLATDAALTGQDHPVAAVGLTGLGRCFGRTASSLAFGSGERVHEVVRPNQFL